MKRIYIIILMLTFFLTGCSAEYNLEISNDEIKEHIDVIILDSDIPETDTSMAEVDDPITPFINNDQYPFPNNYDKIYEKTVNDKTDYTEVSLDYTYSHEEFKESKAYTSCFENKSFEEGDKSYQLNFSGHFYCLYGDSITINIKTNNKVLSHNATKVSGNVYTWVINADNAQDTDISINISKTSAYVNIAIWIVLVIIFIVLGIAGYIVYKKIKNRDLVNEI